MPGIRRLPKHREIRSGMKVVLDENVSGGLARALKKLGHTVLAVGPDLPSGSSDEDVFAFILSLPADLSRPTISGPHWKWFRNRRKTRSFKQSAHLKPGQTSKTERTPILGQAARSLGRAGS